MLIDLHVPRTQQFLQMGCNLVKIDRNDLFRITIVSVLHPTTQFRYSESVLLKTELALKSSNVVNRYVIVLVKLDVRLGNLLFARVAKGVWLFGTVNLVVSKEMD